MSQAPMMPVFIDALLGDTLHLSAEEFGAYCLLLFATWRNNGRALADDDRKLARICRVTEDRWRKRIKPALHGFFAISDGFWHQKRLEKEWKYVEDFAKEQSRKGRLSALKRWGNGVTDPSVRLKPDGNPHTHKRSSSNEELKSIPNGIESGKAQTPPYRDAPAMMTKIWNEECGVITSARAPNLTRRSNCIRRWREDFGSDPGQWRAYCRQIAASPFLRGESARGWRADLDWVLKPENLSHILEGRYDDRLANGRAEGPEGGVTGPHGPAPSFEELFNDDGSRKIGFPH